MPEPRSFPEVPLEKLRWRCDPAAIPFETTESCPLCDEIIGQERALKSLQTGLDIRSLGYNIFITGMVGTGRTTTIKQLLENLEKGDTAPDDLLYVNNFKVPDEPTLMALPAGKGAPLAAAMDALIEKLQSHIPDLLKSPYYGDHRNGIIEEQQGKQKDLLQGFEAEAARNGFSVIQVQMGMFVKPDLIPVIEDAPTPFAKLEAMVREKKFPAKGLEELQKKYDELSGKLGTVLERLREIDEETRTLLKRWDEESIAPLIKDAVAEIQARFPYPKVPEYLADVETTLVDSIELFKNNKKKEKDAEGEPGDDFLPFRVNLIVDNAELKHAPVVIETNPTYVNLFGSIESSMNRMGIIQTDFTRIKAGSFLKANGGFLVVNALDALIEPGVWPTLKRTLRNQVFEIQNYASLFLFAAARLKPQAVKATVKVVMIGDEEIYNLLYFADQDFKKIFKIKAEFDSQMPKSGTAIRDYARFIRKICEEDALLAFDRTAMAAVVEYGTRIAGKDTKLSTRFHVIADVVREASYWAQRDGKSLVAAEHVERAVHERFERVGLIESKIQEMIDEGSILIDTEGAVVGQVNGLSVYDMGQFAFGKPTRITARASAGRAGVINIEREADLSGRTHNKGVLILGGYLRGTYAQDKPLSFSASLAFEQSYGGVDGDSASSTEVYAILSALSRLPLRQDLAVTGSLNQKGEIQPIGGVNEKIEGFFDVCRARGLTGTQGVIIPRQNVQNLMLRTDVVEAAREGKFRIYAVGSIDEGVEILTGVSAGKRGPEGVFEAGTVHALVTAELERLAKAAKGTPSEKEDKER
jgi:lon-related putative ATP-dependent protease